MSNVLLSDRRFKCGGRARHQSLPPGAARAALQKTHAEIFAPRQRNAAPVAHPAPSPASVISATDLSTRNVTSMARDVRQPFSSRDYFIYVREQRWAAGEKGFPGQAQSGMRRASRNFSQKFAKWAIARRLFIIEDHFI